jgi:multidrug transporter EmrE-like cation transporter
MGYLYVAGTIAFTVYGQLVAKWQVGKAGHFPASLGGKLHFLGNLIINPWMISVFAGAFIAAMCWLSALTKFDLNRAYPFMALSFVFVLLLSAAFFSEPITTPRVLGVAFIVAGLAVGSQT